MLLVKPFNFKLKFEWLGAVHILIGADAGINQVILSKRGEFGQYAFDFKAL
jgi:hypothetical protein